MHKLIAQTKNAWSFIEAFLHSFVPLGLRVLFGYMFFTAGYGKLMNLDGVTQFFTSLHIPAPAFNAAFVGGLECVGGIMLILGLFTRLFAFLLSGTLVVAYLTAHSGDLAAAKNFSDWLEAFTKASPFSFLLAMGVLLAFGPGKASLDAALGKFYGKKKSA